MVRVVVGEEVGREDACFSCVWDNNRTWIAHMTRPSILHVALAPCIMITTA